MYPAINVQALLCLLFKSKTIRYIQSSDNVSWLTYSSVYYVICYTTFVRIANELNPDDTLPGVTVPLTACATDDGMALFLRLPDWKDWYEAEVAKLQ